MEVSDVKARVERIRAMAGDPEIAHDEEDKLWADVLVYIGTTPTADNAPDLAMAALETQTIRFPRWTA